MFEEREIKRFGIFSVFKISFVLYFVIFLIFGIIGAVILAFGPGGAIVPPVYQQFGGLPTGGGATTFAIGVAATLIGSVIYGVFGGIILAIMALVYNIIASIVGGVKIRLG